MKFFLLTFAVCVASSFGQTPTPSPDFDCPSMDDSIHPDPNDCAKYFVCTNGLAWHEECPPGLLFNPTKLECDWPEDVVCYGSTRPTTTTTTTTSTTVTMVTTTTTMAPNATDVTTSEDPEPATNATMVTTTTTTTQATSEDPELFVCPQPDGVYPHPADCQLYYVCTGGIALLESCPDGLYFDPILLVCNWPEFVDCIHH